MIEARQPEIVSSMGSVRLSNSSSRILVLPAYLNALMSPKLPVGMFTFRQTEWAKPFSNTFRMIFAAMF